jgi:NTE family protein
MAEAVAVQDRQRVGLALSGGVARGPAHLGVLLALERGQGPVDLVVGASAGALAGALFCAGVPLSVVAERLVDFSWLAIARPVWPCRGWVSFDRLERWLISVIGDRRLEDLPVPLAVVATDLELGEPVVLRDGPLARAVHASCAVPGIAEPVVINDRELGDGGVSLNLPAPVARQMGAGYVIGVDLFRPVLRRRLGPFGYAALALENYVRRSGGGLDACDCLICPDLAGASYFRFNRREEMVRLGEQAAQAQLPVIRAAVLPQPRLPDQGQAGGGPNLRV